MQVPRALDECWAVDTSGRLTEPQYQRLWTTDLRPYSAAVRAWCAKNSVTTPVYPDACGRYGPLAGNGVGQDLTAGELVVGVQTCAQVGRKGGIFVFQHVRAGEKNAAGMDIGWEASEELGQNDAETIINYLDAIGYSVTYASNSAGGLVPHVVQDMENLKNPGPQALAMAQRWNVLVDNCLRLAPGVYNGFNPGLTAQQFADLKCVVARDAGARTPPPGRGFVYEQHEEIVIPGVGEFDVAHVQPDLTGAKLVVMGWQDDPTTDPTIPPPS